MNFNRYYINSMCTDSENYSDISKLSIISIESDNSEYTVHHNQLQNKHQNNINSHNIDYDININHDININRIREMYDRSSLYTTQYRKSVNFEDEPEDENDDLYSIIDFYTQSYDVSVIEPVMQLPLSPNQHILMKKQWSKQLDKDLIQSSVKQISSWPSSNNYNTDFRNSHMSEKSEKSTKSTRSWKSFFNKFSKKSKSKKHQIKFYDNLIKN